MSLDKPRKVLKLRNNRLKKTLNKATIDSYKDLLCEDLQYNPKTNTIRYKGKKQELTEKLRQAIIREIGLVFNDGGDTARIVH